MDEPLTEELLDELLSSPSPQAFLDKHEPGERVLAQYLQELLSVHNLKRKDVVHAAQINETYGYLIFRGDRAHPSRDILLQLSFAMGLSLRETNRLLQAGNVSSLYCKNRRDAILIFCIDRELSLAKTNETLFDFGEAVLGD